MGFWDVILGQHPRIPKYARRKKNKITEDASGEDESGAKRFGRYIASGAFPFVDPPEQDHEVSPDVWYSPKEYRRWKRGGTNTDDVWYEPHRTWYPKDQWEAAKRVPKPPKTYQPRAPDSPIEFDDRAFPREYDMTQPYGPKLPEPVNTLPVPDMSGTKRPRTGGGGGEMEDDDNRAAVASSAGGSSIPFPITQPSTRRDTAGYGGPGVVGVNRATARSTPGARNHKILNIIDEHKSRGRKRAKDGITRLFEASEEWVPFRLLELCGTERVPPTDDLQDQAWQGWLIARSRCTYASILTACNDHAAQNCTETTNNQFLRNGLFASNPAVAGVLGVTPGFRKTELPHIGKLIVNGSLQVQWYGSELETLGEIRQFIHTYDLQLHIVKFSAKWSQLNVVDIVTVRSNAQKFAGILDAADFCLGTGSESYLNGSIMGGQTGITPAGTNVMVAQEEKLYPPRDLYKVHWSSPIITCNKIQDGNVNQSHDEASAAAIPSHFDAPRIDVTNIEIPIDTTISFNSGMTPELNASATNRGDQFANFQLVATIKPRVGQAMVFNREDAPEKALKPYDSVLYPCVTGQLSYMYNFNENDA